MHNSKITHNRQAFSISTITIKQIPILDVANRLGISVNKNKAFCFKGHDKKTASLSFNVTGNYFKCFGCGIGGTTIDLVKEFLNLTTGEAIRWLETQYNASERAFRKGGYHTIGQPKKTQSEPNGELSEAFKQGFSVVYRDFLDTCDYAEAEQYLQDRGISKELSRRFEITTIPKNYVFTNAQKNAGLHTLAKHRLVIPYKDIHGTIVTLQGRNIDDDAEPKYKFLKGAKTSLFNAQALKNLPKGATVYLCEGAIDAISLYELEIANDQAPAVAIAGVNSITDDISTLLDAFKIVVATDTDRAGQQFYIKLKQTYIKKAKQIYKLDFEQIKQDYDVGDAKDINDIARQARRNIYFSHALGETYTLQKNGIKFQSGVFYSHQEIGKIQDCDKDALKIIHAIKKMFQGVIV